MTDRVQSPYWKFAKLGLAGAVLSGAWLGLFWTCGLALAAQDSRDWLTPGLLLVASIPLTALGAVALGPKSYFALTTVLSLGALFFFPGDLFSLLGAAVVCFGFWRAYHRAQFEIHNNIKFASSHITRAVGAIVLLAFMLMLSLQVYARVAAEIANDETAFYSRISDTVTHGLLPIVEQRIPGFESQLTLDQFIINGFSESSPAPAEISLESREAQLAISRSELAETLSIKVTGNEPLSQVVKLAVEEQIRGIVDNFARRGLPLSTLLPAVFALAIFSLLRAVAFVLMFFAEAVSAGLFWFLRVIRFYRVETVQISAERLEI